jgi:carbamoyl-phosphate synthase large subunit
MNLLLSCIGRRGYLAHWFREALGGDGLIVGTSNTRWTAGLAACDRAAIMPDVRSEAYVPTLLELCQAEGITGLLSFFDPDVDAIAGARDRFLEMGIIPVVPSAPVSAIALDKLATREFLDVHGFEAPKTFASLDAARLALEEGKVVLPLVVKPRYGFRSRDVFVARDEAELSVFAAYAPDMIMQERLTGEEHSLDVLNDLDGRVLSVVVKRKVLMRAGETDQAETIAHPAALTLGERLGRELGHVGPLDVDLFIDGDRLTVLELNTRFGGAYPASHMAGADFPRKIVAMLRGERVDRDLGAYEPGVAMMKDYSLLPGFEGEIIDLRTASSDTDPP